jgi:hypothetical protein
MRVLVGGNKLLAHRELFLLGLDQTRRNVLGIVEKDVVGGHFGLEPHLDKPVADIVGDLLLLCRARHMGLLGKPGKPPARTVRCRGFLKHRLGRELRIARGRVEADELVTIGRDRRQNQQQSQGREQLLHG